MADISDPTIQAIIISDHAPINFIMHKETEAKTNPRWGFSTSLFKDKESDSYFKKEWTFFVEINDSANTSPTLGNS